MNIKSLCFTILCAALFALPFGLKAVYATGTQVSPAQNQSQDHQSQDLGWQERQEVRTEIRAMRDNVLAQLYREVPEAAQEIAQADGYAVFNTADVAALIIGGGYGRGLAYNNHTGQETFMRMAAVGFGLGLGARDLNTVFVFNNPGSFDEFVNTGLDLSAHGDLIARQGGRGAGASLAEDILPGVHIYQLTNTGLMAQIMARGTRFWRDGALNEMP